MKVYVGDIGTKITVDVKEDVSSATTLELIFRKPDLSEITRTATLESDTKISYTTISGDLDQFGRWRIQAHIVAPTFDVLGETDIFDVHEKFEGIDG